MARGTLRVIALVILSGCGTTTYSLRYSGSGAKLRPITAERRTMVAPLLNALDGGKPHPKRAGPSSSLTCAPHTSMSRVWRGVAQTPTAIPPVNA